MSPLRLIRSWIITPIFLIIFGCILVGFHLPLMIASMISKRLEKHILDLMNWSIIQNIRWIAGAKYRVINRPNLPAGRSVLLVANHQSMYDIPMIMWEMRDRELGFIAKKELGRGIPSISFALRTLGSVLIDRKDARGSVSAIEQFANQKERDRQVACIFPEGTRARDGVVKPFKVKGFETMHAAMPTALILPVVVSGNWELLRYGFKPVPIGVEVSLEFLTPIEIDKRSNEQVLSEVEGLIRGRLGQSLGSSA